MENEIKKVQNEEEVTENDLLKAAPYLFDKEMSLKAKGLLSLMLSLPKDWLFSAERLCDLSSDGSYSTNAALKELEDLGYLSREKLHKNGYFTYYYNIYQTSQKNVVREKDASIQSKQD